MEAINVTYADDINKAADQYGVSPALLQAILDDAPSGQMPALPDLARRYAMQYATRIEADVEDLDGGVQHPESNIMATAQWLSYMFGREQNQWVVIEAFYGGGPRGRIAMMHLASGSYERRRRQWS